MDRGKKDVFNGNIREEFRGMTIFTLIYASVVLFACGIAIGVIGFVYDKIELSARILMYIVSGLSLVAGLVYPIVTLVLIRIYPKHKKLAHLFLKAYVFNDDRDP